MNNVDSLRHNNCFCGLFNLTSPVEKVPQPQVKVLPTQKKWDLLKFLMTALSTSTLASLLG